MTIYGIKTCGSVKKAFAYCRAKGIAYDFIDFKQTPPTREQVERWLQHVEMKVLMNTKGPKYRTLKLKEMNLSDEEAIEWLLKEPLLVKRPVIETDSGGVLVAYDEAVYAEKLSG